MNKKLPTLPMELINKILIMRPTHPVANLLNRYIRRFNYKYKDWLENLDTEWNRWCHIETYLYCFHRFALSHIFNSEYDDEYGNGRLYEDDDGNWRYHHRRDFNIRYDEFDEQSRKEEEIFEFIKDRMLIVYNMKEKEKKKKKFNY
jgi:hypothetical protein